MIYIPTNLLKPNMVLARTIPSAAISLPLLVSGKKLGPLTLLQLRRNGIQGAYIQNDFFNDIDAEDLVEPELKRQLLTEIKAQFDVCLKKTVPVTSVQTFQTVSRMAESLVLNVLNKDQILFNVIDIRDFDSYTYSHSLYVGILSVLIGTQLGLSRDSLVELAIAGILHDIGKLDIPLEIVNKPGALTAEEYERVKQHPALAAARLASNQLFSSVVVRGIRSHHEKYDGTGYPAGMKEEEIPLFGRILAIADVYDALSSARPYRKAWSSSRIINYMMSCSGSHFDPELLSAFLHAVAAYPVGSMVLLSDGSTGVVVDNTPGYTLRPSVRLVSPPEAMGIELNLAEERWDITIAGSIGEEELETEQESDKSAQVRK